MTLAEQNLRDEICRIGDALFSRGYAHSTAGNISARLDDGYLITPTDACLGFLDPARLAKLSKDGAQISGDRASKTILLHAAIYREDERVGGIVHTHSTHLVALSLVSEVGAPSMLPPITPYFVMKVGPIPLVPYRRPGAPEVVDLVRPFVRERRGAMLQSLGPIVWHRSVSAAAFALEELEETAKLWLMTRDRSPRILADAEVEDLRRTFGST